MYSRGKEGAMAAASSIYRTMRPRGLGQRVIEVGFI
jgi:hypothetical protein